MSLNASEIMILNTHLHLFTLPALNIFHPLCHRLSCARHLLLCYSTDLILPPTSPQFYFLSPCSEKEVNDVSYQSSISVQLEMDELERHAKLRKRVRTHEDL